MENRALAASLTRIRPQQAVLCFAGRSSSLSHDELEGGGLKQSKLSHADDALPMEQRH